jgi:LPS O-antigen subunit length determinant protein (WzzB/FepE family)
MSQIIVSFSPGTSGRFISTISYMLENNLNKEVKWTDNNSAHDIDIEVPINLLTKEILFLNRKSWQVKFTHKYPDFELIKKKIPNCKIIVIGYTEDDITEVIFNQLLKNYNHTDNNLYKVSNMGLYPFKKMGNFDKDPFLKEKLIFPPEQYKEDILVIMYNDIYKEENNSFIILEKLSKFLNKPINENILNSYKDYVDGRNRILEENKEYIDRHKQMLQENNTPII